MGIKEKPYYLYLLALLSGFILWLGWPTKPFCFAIFLGFVPLLVIEDSLAQSNQKYKGWKFLGYAYIALLVWNILTTYWIYNATAGGGIFAIAANAALMCIPIMFFYFTKKLSNAVLGHFALIVYWITFEYWHLNWELSWPWLTLGNAFASAPSFVQWYEYTGALGGTFWIMLVNVVLFRIFFYKGRAQRRIPYRYFIPLLLIIVPLVVSLIMYVSYQDQGKEIEVVVVQPNIDPYTEKFMGSEKFVPYEEQMKRLISLSEKVVTDSTDYLVWPETALPSGYIESDLKDYPLIAELGKFVATHPHLSLVTGLDTYKIYQTKATPSSTYLESYQGYLDAFNAAMQLNADGSIVVYHKSKLVPGVEYMPPAISSLAIAMGESAHGLGKEKERTVFFNRDSVGIAPVICYESIFGDFVTEYIRKGAGLIFIITNDGWWGNTQGHKQHLQFASLRAIETRRSIARSANTGISGFIDQKGTILQRSDYWKQDVMKMRIKENGLLTFYVRHGDYIGFFSLYLSVLTLVAAAIFQFKKRSK